MSTRFLTKEDALKGRKWHIVDADGIPVGRLASEVAVLIRGKNSPKFTPHQDGGDFVVVINAEKIKFTGNKLEKKIYYDHTQFIGGLKQITAGALMEKNPASVVTRAVRGMLPKSALGHNLIKKLKVYTGTEHPHGAQNPEAYKIKFVERT